MLGLFHVANNPPKLPAIKLLCIILPFSSRSQMLLPLSSFPNDIAWSLTNDCTDPLAAILSVNLKLPGKPA